MKIVGLQKLTLLDFPGKVACTVFLGGCNLRCPYCHNSELLGSDTEPSMAEQELLDFLKNRRGLLDGVCITGGEPTLSSGLKELMKDIKAMGYRIKLDTNGSRPDVLKELVLEGLVDYVAMDIKNAPSRYARTCGLPRLNLLPFEESAAFLINGSVDFEFRTTVVKEFHDEASMEEMGHWLSQLSGEKGSCRLFLQFFVDRDTVAFSGLHPVDSAEMTRFAELLQGFGFEVSVRG